MKKETILQNGKKKMIITRSVSGVDKTKEAVARVMGKDWEYKETENIVQARR